MDLSVIVTSYSSPRTLRLCLAHLRGYFDILSDHLGKSAALSPDNLRTGGPDAAAGLHGARGLRIARAIAPRI